MRCVSYCTAELYHVDSLAKFLRNQGYDPKFYDDIIHIEKCSLSHLHQEESVQHIFFFPYGCVVLWGFEREEGKTLLEEIKPFEVNSVPIPPFDECTYQMGNDTFIQEEDDLIILDSNEVLVKLAFSHALSQSVKLDIFEHSVAKSIEKTRYIPKELARYGKIPLSRHKLAKKVGALFAERNLINLHSDILDTPEFFWRRPKYENFYRMASKYLDINTRLDILNQRLNIIHELYEVLSNELNHAHSSRFEIIIILLIAFEVVLGILHMFHR